MAGVALPRVSGSPGISRVKHPIALCLLCLVTAAALGVDSSARVPPNERAGFQFIREGDLKADLTFLASDATEGRMSPQPGDEVAAQWVAAEFAKAGLEPAARDASAHASFSQDVPLIEYRSDREKNYVEARIAQAHSAVALLIVGEPNRKHPSNLERVALIGGSIVRNCRSRLRS
jgi:hypothetical protein